jgi:hypothetical protein
LTGDPKPIGDHNFANGPNAYINGGSPEVLGSEEKNSKRELNGFATGRSVHRSKSKLIGDSNIMNIAYNAFNSRILNAGFQGASNGLGSPRNLLGTPKARSGNDGRTLLRSTEKKDRTLKKNGHPHFNSVNNIQNLLSTNTDPHRIKNGLANRGGFNPDKTREKFNGREAWEEPGLQA